MATWMSRLQKHKIVETPMVLSAPLTPSIGTQSKGSLSFNGGLGFGALKTTSYGMKHHSSSFLFCP
nr:hypothetical protein Itr_chr05CG22230 [Ipomoea trifida]